MDEAAAKTIYHRAWLAVKKQGETPNEAHTSTLDLPESTAGRHDEPTPKTRGSANPSG